MIGASDLVRIPYNAELCRAGIEVACQRLAVSGPTGKPVHGGLRRMAMQASAELALRRYLQARQARYEIIPRNPFDKPVEYELLLDGRRCTLVIQAITRQALVESALKQDSLLLEGYFTMPLAELALGERREADLYLFACVLAQELPRRRDALAQDGGALWLYLFPERWRHPPRWAPLGKVLLSTKAAGPLEVLITGWDAARSLVNESLAFHPDEPVRPRTQFYSLVSLRANRPPEREIGLTCSRFTRPLVIAPMQWSNVWVYGKQIILMGWLTQGEIRRGWLANRSRLATFSNQAESVSIPIRRLHPLRELGWQDSSSRVQ